MTIDEARQWAAQAWCTVSTSDRVMDPALAEQFAVILQRRVTEAILSYEVQRARKLMALALKDQGFRQGYVANLAMLLHDRYGVTDHATRNSAAEDILKLLFDDAA